VYLPYTTWLGVYVNILVRTRVPPLSVLHAVRMQVQSVDGDQQVDQHVPTLDELITTRQEWQEGYLVTRLLGGFAALALALAEWACIASCHIASLSGPANSEFGWLWGRRGVTYYE
jgi:hypothetical protein